MTTFDITFTGLRAGYRAGRSPTHTIREVYRRIAEVGDPGIFLHLRDEATLLAEAEGLGAFDPDRPLWGIPFAIKDNIDLGGAPTTAACPAYAYEAPRDAHVVARLRAAGALLIGKTNLDQFATGLVGIRSPFAPPRNAVDPRIVPGGSSSGSAVAVAQGIAAFSLGTDTAGSGRVPAALNNIVGLKPTLGMLSASGVVPACRTLDTISIFALEVDDAHEVLRAASDCDPSDPYARAFPAPPLGTPPALGIGVPDAATLEFFGDTAQAASYADSLARLEALGHGLREIDFTPFFDVARMLYEGAWVAERMTVIEDLLRRDPDAILPVTRGIIGAADGLSAADAFRGLYRLAELRRSAESALAGIDLLCVPTIPTFYSLADLAADPIGPNARLGTYTNFVNLMDMCGIAVPTAPRRDGRPGSVTVLAAAGRDSLAASLARQLQHDCAAPLGATGLAPRPPASEPAHALPSEIALAVVGAHMSGLPLNHELTSRGARFLEATQTASCYRLHALAGGPPERPGLIRDTTAGSAIALEIWAMPRAAMGDFISGIPAPLCVGRVRLADGREVAGFLVEGAGLTDSAEITRHGGWRAYLSELDPA